jgi:hypothetical protein
MNSVVLFDPSILEPGDVLLYYEKDFIDTIIAEKTGKAVGHIERYVGNGKSVASRNGVGVNEYDLRLTGLVCVRRAIPVVSGTPALDFSAGMDWFNKVAKGQKYDFEGLLTFTSFFKSGHDGEMFCSEFAVNFDRACGFEPFNPDQPPFETSPRDYWICGAFQTIWKSDSEY